MSRLEEARKTITVENIVATTSIGHDLDLTALVEVLNNTEYTRAVFPGLVYRAKNPRIAVLIFGSGKIVITGAKSYDDVEAGFTKLFEKLVESGVRVEKNTISVQNIVASADLGSIVNLNAIAISLGLENIEYEPEQFPGLIYRLKSPKAAILVFSSGKLVVTGCKSIGDTIEVVDYIVKEFEGLTVL